MDNLLYLCNVWKSRSYINSNVPVSSIFNNGQFYLKYYFLYHRNTFYICIKFVERHSKDVWNISLDDVGIMMFCGCPENVNLTHSTKFITITLLKHSSSVPPGNKNSRVYLMSHKFRRDVPGTSESDVCIVTSLERPQDINFKHNTKRITAVLFSILLTKFVA